jgi:hypothetical protein
MSPASRSFVPDLSPEAHPEIRWKKIRQVFIAESPHVSEVTPEKSDERRPLCGMAGRAWWGMLSEIAEGKRDEDVSLERLLRFCASRGIAILNAVQFPLDPGVAKKVPAADPLKTIGFSKATGPRSYKRMRDSSEVKRALQSLRKRLDHPALKGADLYTLGLDADWFVKRAEPEETAELSVKGRLPHPSAWWRRGGHFGRVARAQLEEILHKTSS